MGLQFWGALHGWDSKAKTRDLKGYFFFVKLNFKKMKKLSNARMHSYMHPICTLYAPYMAHILRARARARPALVGVGPLALTHKES